jgi:hypothetical protein
LDDIEWRLLLELVVVLDDREVDFWRLMIAVSILFSLEKATVSYDLLIMGHLVRAKSGRRVV